MGVLDGLFQKPIDERYATLKEFYKSDKDNRDLPFKTDLTDREIVSIVLVEFLDDYMSKNWNIKLNLKTITNGIKKHKVSRNRMGRAEMVQVLKGAEIEEQKTQNVLRKALGV